MGSEMCIRDRLRHVADSTNLLPNGPRQLTHDEVYEILMECI